MCAEARDAGYIRNAFISDAVAGRSAARGRHTIVRQNVTFPQIYPTLVCGESHPAGAAAGGPPSDVFTFRLMHASHTPQNAPKQASRPHMSGRLEDRTSGLRMVAITILGVVQP